MQRRIVFPSKGLQKKKQRCSKPAPSHLLTSTLPLESLILPSSSFPTFSLVTSPVCLSPVCVCVCVCRPNCWRCRISRWSWKRIKEPKTWQFTNRRADLAACCFWPSAEANYLNGPHLDPTGSVWLWRKGCLVRELLFSRLIRNFDDSVGEPYGRGKRSFLLNTVFCILLYHVIKNACISLKDVPASYLNWTVNRVLYLQFRWLTEQNTGVIPFFFSVSLWPVISFLKGTYHIFQHIRCSISHISQKNHHDEWKKKKKKHI